jgi:lysophospholipase L1-like esterase
MRFSFAHRAMNPLMLKRVAIGLLLCSTAALAPGQCASGVRWTTAWAAAPDSAGPALKPQTIRQVVRTSVGGSGVRIRLSNLFGAGPVTIGPVRVALHAAGAAIQPASDHALTFAGQRAVTIAKGDSAWSDPIDMDVRAAEDLVISMYLPAQTGSSTIHGTAMQTAFIIRSTDATAATTFPAEATDDSRYFLTDVEVVARADPRSLVVVGDSITDGVGSTEDGNARWPDALAARLQGDPALASIAVVNSGISGNRLLHDAAKPFVGPSALSRFERDALGKPGVRWILLLEGINDITAADMLGTPGDQVSAQQIIDGMKQLIARAHEKGIRIWGGTLLPLKGVRGFNYSEAGETKRQAINAWIRSAGAFDAVVDFEQALRDPSNPARLNPVFDSGDHLHPNDAGYKAMAALIDLRLFSGEK